MSQPLYDALAVCLDALERGDPLEACLVRYPQFAAELRPILETAQSVKAGSAGSPPVDAVRRGRTRVLRRAGELRDRQASSNRTWLFGRAMRLGALSLTLLAFTIAGGTGLVSASSGSIPGDRLYSVKRTWEDIRLQLTFSSGERESLEDTYDHERLEEINELFKERRVARVTFAGVLEAQSASRWTVAGIPVAVTSRTLVDANLLLGDLVQVTGETQADGSVVAQEISAFVIELPQTAATATPRIEDKVEPTEIGEPTEAGEGAGSGEDQPTFEPTEDHSGGAEGQSTAEPTKDKQGGSDNSGPGGGDGGGGNDGGNDGGSGGGDGGDDH